MDGLGAFEGLAVPWFLLMTLTDDLLSDTNREIPPECRIFVMHGVFFSFWPCFIHLHQHVWPHCFTEQCPAVSLCSRRNYTILHKFEKKKPFRCYHLTWTGVFMCVCWMKRSSSMIHAFIWDFAWFLTWAEAAITKYLHSPPDWQHLNNPIVTA